MYSYLASAYSAPPDLHPAQASLWRTDRYFEARGAVAFLCRQGIVGYSPIVHFHDVAAHHVMPTDAGYWRIANEAMIYCGREVVVLKNQGWEVSKGVAHEIQFAKNMGKSVRYLEIDGETFKPIW